MKTTLLLSCLLLGAGVAVKKNGTRPSPATGYPNALNAAPTKRPNSLMPIAPVSIVVDKSNYEMYVYDAKGWYATYPVVFGNPSLEDKKVEGDRNTPEGTFRIVNKRVHDKWDRYLGLDYPNAESLAKFKERKRRGEIPSNATPGAGIGIHGVWPHEDFVIDRYKNWTNGCISLKNPDVEEIYRYIDLGTPVTIRK